MVSSMTKENGARSGVGTTPYEDALEPYRRLENAFKQYGRGELPLAALLSQIDGTAADRRRVARTVSTWLDTPDAALDDDVVATMRRGLSTADEAEVPCTRVVDDAITVELDSPGDPRPPVNASDPAQRFLAELNGWRWTSHGLSVAAWAAIAAGAAVALAYTYLEHSTVSEAPAADAPVTAEGMPPLSPRAMAMSGDVALVEARGQESEAGAGLAARVSSAPALAPQGRLEPKRDPVPEPVPAEAGEETRRQTPDLLAPAGDPEDGAVANAVANAVTQLNKDQAVSGATGATESAASRAGPRQSRPDGGGDPAGEEELPTAPRWQASASLQVKAQRQLAAQRSTPPTGDNARETFGNVVQIDPRNDQAHTDPRAIADRIEALAQAKRWEGSLHESLSIAEEGLRVLPSHGGLQALRNDLKAQLEAPDNGASLEPAPAEDGRREQNHQAEENRPAWRPRNNQVRQAE